MSHEDAQGVPGGAVLDEDALFNHRYQVRGRIGSGGMGAIYEVVHVETRRRRALKVMLPSLVLDASQRARFQREATITAGVRCEYLVDVFDAGVDADTGRPFLVMELLDGSDLAEHLKERGPMPPAEALALLGQAALALDNTHVAGIVHLDIKPQNLFVGQRDDGSLRLKVLDFGLAGWVAALGADRVDGPRAGTPLYMAPEQLGGPGPIGPAADLYALAHIAFQMLTGASYWQEDRHRMTNVFALRTIVDWGPPEPASARAARRGIVLPPAFDAWFARAAAPRAEARFAHASTMIVALAEALGEAIPELSGPMSAPLPPSAPPSSVSLRDLGSAHEIPATITPSVPVPAARRRTSRHGWAGALALASTSLVLGATGALVARRAGDTAVVTVDPPQALDLPAAAAAPPAGITVEELQEPIAVRPPPADAGAVRPHLPASVPRPRRVPRRR